MNIFVWLCAVTGVIVGLIIGAVVIIMAPVIAREQEDYGMGRHISYLLLAILLVVLGGRVLGYW